MRKDLKYQQKPQPDKRELHSVEIPFIGKSAVVVVVVVVVGIPL